MNLNDLSPELKAKVQECKNTEELLALARNAGTELTDEQLDGVSGSVNWNCPGYDENCPKHGFERAMPPHFN